MSQENVELIRRGIEAYVAGDWETWLEGFDPEIEWIEMPSLGPDASTYRGIKEVRRAVESWIGMWTDYKFEVRDYFDAGDEVVVLVQESGRGRSTGAAVERQLGEICTIDSGKLSRLRMYGSWAEALEAAGLSE
jgi:ketosteroid isomerase-like protein